MYRKLRLYIYKPGILKYTTHTKNLEYLNKWVENLKLLANLVYIIVINC